MNEDDLLRRLASVEALFAGAMTPGEREAAGRARDRIRERLAAIEVTDPAVEYRFTVHDPWSRRLLFALLSRYGLRGFRYRRQRRQTVMCRVPKSFVDDTLWPEFQELNKLLSEHLDQVAQRIISQAIHVDSEEVIVEVGELPVRILTTRGGSHLMSPTSSRSEPSSARGHEPAEASPRPRDEPSR